MDTTRDISSNPQQPKQQQQQQYQRHQELEKNEQAISHTDDIVVYRNEEAKDNRKPSKSKRLAEWDKSHYGEALRSLDDQDGGAGRNEAKAWKSRQKRKRGEDFRRWNLFSRTKA